MKKASLFIGRWQPFHHGHKELIETVLKTGKPVVVGVRDTTINAQNPYSINDRISMIKRHLLEYDNAGLVRIAVIPDIDEICVGRKPGYSIRQIRLDKKIELISGTKTRSTRNRVIWLTGNTGAGKTTLAYLLKERLSNAVVLDGDEMRGSISLGAGFSKKEREDHNLRVARLAKVLYRQRNNVIVSVIAPFKSTRKKIEKIIKPQWFYIKREMVADREKPYEPPKNAVLIDTDKYSILDCLELIMEELK